MGRVFRYNVDAMKNRLATRYDVNSCFSKWFFALPGIYSRNAEARMPKDQSGFRVISECVLKRLFRFSRHNICTALAIVHLGLRIRISNGTIFKRCTQPVKMYASTIISANKNDVDSVHASSVT